MANANQVIINGKTILDLRSDTVTPETLQKGYTAHDKSGTKITGTLEASSSGGAKETWVIKNSATGELETTQISFTSNGQKFTSIGANYIGTFVILCYDNNEVAGYEPGAGAGFEFENEAYRKLTFDTPPTGELLTWLQSNAVKQPDDTAVQPTNAPTITSNGTVSVTPDAPYDALKKVDVTVNVASGGGGGETAENVVITSSLPSYLNEYIQICGIDKDGNKILLNGYTTPVSVKKNTPLMIRISEYPYAIISGQYTVIGVYAPSQNSILDTIEIGSGDNKAPLIVPTGDLNIYNAD